MAVERSTILPWLELSAPDWVTIVEQDTDQLAVNVSPRLQSGAPTEVFQLFIDIGSAAGGARERVTGSRFPRSCSERHINFDGTFCLGLGRPAVIDEEGGARFWETLRTYLLSQLFAEKHGRWPPGRGLSHGDAAYLQLKAEQAAAVAGLSEAYATALDHLEGWLSGDLPQLIEGGDDHACDGSGSVMRSLNIRPDCGRCIAVAELVRLEQERRRSEANFIAWSATVRVCCNTMPRCELRNYLHGEQIMRTSDMQSKLGT